jgi:hypothetical protein
VPVGLNSPKCQRKLRWRGEDGARETAVNCGDRGADLSRQEFTIASANGVLGGRGHRLSCFLTGQLYMDELLHDLRIVEVEGNEKVASAVSMPV